MNKSGRNILILIAILLLLFGVVLAVYSNFKSKPINANVEKDKILDDANTGLENLLNNIILDEDNKENVENVEENTTKNEQVSNTQAQDKNQSSNEVIDNQTTPGEKKAIELAKAQWKKEWGSLDEVSFNNVTIQGDGKYVVSVNDSKTTKVICRYVVDTNTGIVEEQ